jgi:hypothetical protein
MTAGVSGLGGFGWGLWLCTCLALYLFREQTGDVCAVGLVVECVAHGVGALMGEV